MAHFCIHGKASCRTCPSFKMEGKRVRCLEHARMETEEKSTKVTIVLDDGRLYGWEFAFPKDYSLDEFIEEWVRLVGAKRGWQEKTSGYVMAKGVFWFFSGRLVTRVPDQETAGICVRLEKIVVEYADTLVPETGRE